MGEDKDMSDECRQAYNCNPNQHVPSLLGGAENMKLLFDDTMAHMSRSNKFQERINEENFSNSRAWEALKLRIAHNSATIDHAISAGALVAGQVGVTEGQQTVSPAGTAASEGIKGAVGVSAAGVAVAAETVAANMAQLMTSIVPVIATAIGTITAQTVAAILPVIVTAAGGASTPSQTSSKPDATTK